VTVNVMPAQACRPAEIISPGKSAPKNGRATIRKRDTATPEMRVGVEFALFVGKCGGSQGKPTLMPRYRAFSCEHLLNRVSLKGGVDCRIWGGICFHCCGGAKTASSGRRIASPTGTASPNVLRLAVLSNCPPSENLRAPTQRMSDHASHASNRL
jgi:hypothetical protein